LILAAQVVFPNADDLPTVSPKRSSNSRVACSIRQDFLQPIRITIFLKVVAPKAAVPEATVDKNDSPTAQKDHVGVSKKSSSEPISISFGC
jgi:hypothetical protein